MDMRTPTSPRFFPVKLIIILILALSLLIAGCDDDDDDDKVSLTMLETSDIHNHASGYGPYADYTPLDTTDNDSVSGGFARLAAKIKAVRQAQQAKDIPVLLVDAGDFTMGTIYDMAMQPPVTLSFLDEMGYDAVTLGNHEFDWGPAGLAAILRAAGAFGFDVPIVASTLQTDPDSSQDDGIETLIASRAIVSKRVINCSNGVRIGFLGMPGPDAINDMPGAAPVTFVTDYPAIQTMVDDLRNNDNVELVVVLSHGGVEPDGAGDDADLAQNLNGIDIIASGHYHTAGESVFEINDTLIISPGAYGKWLSRLDFVFNKDTGEIDSYDYSLIAIDDTINGDEEIQTTLVEGAETEINQALQANGLGTISDVVSTTTFDLATIAFTESNLGNFAADAIRFSANQVATAVGGDPYDVGVVANGVIRDGLYTGKTGAITFADAYAVVPLGISPASPEIPGYPLMSVYVNAAEIRNACEISASISKSLGSSYYLNFSGIRYGINPESTPGSMVQQVSLVAPTDTETQTAGTPIDITDATTLYRVVVDYYALLMMNYATDMGLPIVPKDVEGNPIPASALLDYRIDQDPITEGIQEMKEWMGVMGYFQYIGQAYGGQIPESVYGEAGAGMGRTTIIGAH